MIATKTLLLMVMGLAGGQNGGRARNGRVLAGVLAWHIGIFIESYLNLSLNVIIGDLF